MGGLLGNGVTIGAVVAIGMTLLLEAISSRRSRLEVTLDMASLPAIDEFLARLATRLEWNEASTLRLRSAGEETLASLLSQADDADGSNSPRLIIVARPQRTMVELEFVATTRHENIEDQLAYLTDEAPYRQSMIFHSGCCDTKPPPCATRSSTAWTSSRTRSRAAPDSGFEGRLNDLGSVVDVGVY